MRAPADFPHFSDAQEFLAKHKGGSPFDYARDNPATMLAAESLGVGHQVARAIAISREMGPVVRASVQRAEETFKRKTLGAAVNGALRDVALFDRREPGVPATHAEGARGSVPSSGSEGARAILRAFSAIQSRSVRWLWPGRIARGKVSMIAGNPGLGKSQATASMAAIVTRGGTWPVDRSPCERGSVIFLSAEDDPEDTIRPRLEAAGADLGRCFILDAIADGFTSEGGEVRRSFNLKTDLARLGEAMAKVGDVALVVVDPISAYLGGADSHNNAEIRALLAPLSELASAHGAAIVGVSHLNKGGNPEALMRVTGSLAFVAAARAAYIVTADKENPERRLFLPLKNNLGRDLGGLAFSIESIGVMSAAGRIESSRVSWEASPVTITADEAMAPPPDAEERSAASDAVAWLNQLIAEESGSIDRRDVMKAAQAMGFKERTVHRAREQLGLAVVQTGFGKDKRSLWKRPEEPMRANETQSCQPPSVGTHGISGTHGAAGDGSEGEGEDALMALIERVAAHYKAGPDELAELRDMARANPSEAWRSYRATAEREGLQ